MGIPNFLALAAMAMVAAPQPLFADEGVEPDLDVPYVPTPQPVVEEMLRMAGVGADDVVYDLGSGDGRVVITAAEQYGARAVGIDLDPARVAESRENAKAAGVEERVRFIQQDLFEADIGEATVVTLYLLRSINEQLRPKLLEELRPGTRVVSHDFDMGQWTPKERAYVNNSSIYLLVVPGRAEGRWEGILKGPDGEQPLSLALSQAIQHLSGTVTVQGDYWLLGEAEVDGREVRMELINGTGESSRLEGTIDGDRIAGRVLNGADSQPIGEWAVTRVALATAGGLQSRSAAE